MSIKHVTNWLEKREDLFKWSARLSQILLIPLFLVCVRWGKLELEKYGRDNFASAADIAELRNEFATVKATVNRLEAKTAQMVTHKENDENIRESARKEAVILQQISTLNVKVDSINETVKEMRTDVRELRQRSAVFKGDAPQKTTHGPLVTYAK